jgi:hypothetical protein
VKKLFRSVLDTIELYTKTIENIGSYSGLMELRGNVKKVLEKYNFVNKKIEFLLLKNRKEKGGYSLINMGVPSYYIMKKVKMNMEILNIIHVVKDYKRFIRSYYCHVMKKKKFDWYDKTKKFYSTLPLPKELNTSKNCFDNVLEFPEEELRKLDNINAENLHNYEYTF